MKKGILLALMLLYFPIQAFGQFYKIYGYATPEANEKEFVYWFTNIPSSDNNYLFFGNTVDRQGLMAHSLEMEYGISNRFAVAMYLDFEHPSGESIRWIKTKAVMLHYRLYEKKARPIDIAFYLEYILPRKNYKKSEELEFKFILEKDIGFNTIVLNPTFEKKISGEDVAEGTEFNFSVGYYYRKSLVFQPGIEFYSKTGELYDPKSFEDQSSHIFPTIDLFLGSKGAIHWHAGVGFGLTDPSDNIIIKSILSYEFF